MRPHLDGWGGERGGDLIANFAILHVGNRWIDGIGWIKPLKLLRILEHCSAKDTIRDVGSNVG